MAAGVAVAVLSTSLLATCAPEVAPETLSAVIEVESGGRALALNVNGPLALGREPADAAEAAALARAAIEAGYTVDLGLMQVNSSNLSRLGFTLEEMFEPCANLRAGAAILLEAYAAAEQVHGPGQRALRSALSMYNTGSLTRGFENGYVARYVGEPVADAPRRSGPDPYTAGTLVFTREGEPMKREGLHIEHDPIITTDPVDLDTPGVVLEVGPQEAERRGAFEESALGAEEAWDSNDDLAARPQAGAGR